MKRSVEARLMVHGGAWDIPEQLHQEHLEGIEQALRIGQHILKTEDDALKTVLKVLKFLEDFPVFDAGRGSFLNAAGQVEMDAGLMVGQDRSSGAVAAIQNIAHPIEAAELVRRKTQHILLVGQGATAFAHQQGVAPVKTIDLLVGRERERYLKMKKKRRVRIKTFFEKGGRSDTVGVVAINSKGQIVAGTSTGGTPFKLPGRVGDSPIVGAGFYADDRWGGASATGWGEGILTIGLSGLAVRLLKQGLNAKQAAEQAIASLKEQTDGEGGLILIDKQGEIGYAYNTPYMAVGAASSERIFFVRV